MKELSHIISELLYDYDCVIVPELGGFITNYRSAFINEDNDVLFPPSKALGFNRNLVQNDGLLANYISSKQNVSFENACDRIKKQVELCFSDLNNGHRIAFDKVGILYLDDEKSIQFEPDESVNYLTSSFGLIQFHYPPLLEQKKLEQTKELVLEEEIHQTPVIPIQRTEINKVRVKGPVVRPDLKKNPSETKFKYWAVAALIPMLLYVGMVAWQSDVLKGGDIHSSDLNPFRSLKNTFYKARTSLPTELEYIQALKLDEEILLNGSNDEIDQENANDDLPKEVLELEKPEVIEKIEKTSDMDLNKRITIEIPELSGSLFASPEIGTKKYHVINGCYGVLSNAEKQTTRLRQKGYDAYILDKKGKLYRVSQGSLDDPEKAIELLQAAKSNDDPTAWLLKK